MTGLDKDESSEMQQKIIIRVSLVKMCAAEESVRCDEFFRKFLGAWRLGEKSVHYNEKEKAFPSGSTTSPVERRKRVSFVIDAIRYWTTYYLLKYFWLIFNYRMFYNQA